MKTSAAPLVTLLLAAGAALLFPVAGTSAPDESSAANPTAYQAIRAARAALGAEELGRLVEVTGRDGVPQPYIWKITLKEGANSSKEVDVANGKVVAQRTVPHAPASTAVVKLQALNLDSSGAFDAADAQSRKVRVRFDTINYVLRANEKGQPVWAMELFNQDGVSVGNMRLTATDGVIASMDGRLANGPGRPGQPMTASNNPAPPSTVSTTTTVETTTTVPPPPPPSTAATEPPPVHDVDNPPASTVTVSDSTEGGFFTRAGRTLDHTQDNVVHHLDTAQDNVVRSIDTAHQKVEHSLRATGAKLERFFTGHSDLDHN
jgi:hypothetical protein